jgi:hypothetical protein
MINRFWVAMAVLLVIPWLIFTTSCARKEIISEPGVTRPPMAEEEAEAKRLAEEKALEEQRLLEEQLSGKGSSTKISISNLTNRGSFLKHGKFSGTRQNGSWHTLVSRLLSKAIVTSAGAASIIWPSETDALGGPTVIWLIWASCLNA